MFQHFCIVPKTPVKYINVSIFVLFFKQDENETPRTLSPIETPREDTMRAPEEPIDTSQQDHWRDLQETSVSPTNENTGTSEEGEVKKKKKKKKKRKQNKTAPIDEDSYELPPVNAWDSPPAILNGFPGSSGVSPRRLEPLGPPRLPGTVFDNIIKPHQFKILNITFLKNLLLNRIFLHLLIGWV